MVKLNLEKIETIALQLATHLKKEQCDNHEAVSCLFLTAVGITVPNGIPIDAFFPLCYSMEKCVQKNLQKIIHAQEQELDDE